LPTSFARGFDRLSSADHGRFEDAIVRWLNRDELLRAHGAGVRGLLEECELADDDERIRQRLHEMVTPRSL
jgi:hypothetical protein